MHEKFVTDFDERERQLLGKIRELEIRLLENRNSRNRRRRRRSKSSSPSRIS
jgi:hypothetical protein